MEGAAGAAGPYVLAVAADAGPKAEELVGRDQEVFLVEDEAEASACLREVEDVGEVEGGGDYEEELGWEEDDWGGLVEGHGGR